MKNSKKTLEELVEQFVKTLNDELGEVSTIIAISPKNSDVSSCCVQGCGAGILCCLDAIEDNEVCANLSKIKNVITAVKTLKD